MVWLLGVFRYPCILQNTFTLLHHDFYLFMSLIYYQLIHKMFHAYYLPFFCAI